MGANNLLLFSSLVLSIGCAGYASAPPLYGQAAPVERVPVWSGNEVLGYHRIRTDAKGMLLPWYAANPAIAYDHVIRLVWSFWDHMPADRNGLPYYMNHQVWRPKLDDHRGIGGDQIQMALSSWALLYQYRGSSYNRAHDRIVENMKFMADWYLSHGMSAPDAAWPNLPYPYNTLVYSGQFDGDMVIGRGYTQPDKAGSLGMELVTLYKITQNPTYLEASIAIADTLAQHTQTGDHEQSPLPFKVHAERNVPGQLAPAKGNETQKPLVAGYTSNWSGTLELFMALKRLREQGESQPNASETQIAAYDRAFDRILAWMKEHPLQTNKWGPFFEDVWGWSDTQINAVTFAEFIMNHRELFPQWQKNVKGILLWVERNLANTQWQKHGVIAIDEQTAYRQPGNSHTARQAAAQLRFAELTGDETHKDMAVRQLNWATYMVDHDGKNFYPRDDIWLTDGYGDYVRHYLRSVAAAPELAPLDQDHILRSSSVVTRVSYGPQALVYSTFEDDATEIIRMDQKPTRVWLGDPGKPARAKQLKRADNENEEGWTWKDLAVGGVLTVHHRQDRRVNVERRR